MPLACVGSFFSIMASSSTVPQISEMAELRAQGLGVPILFPIGLAGFASVSASQLSIRFGLQESSIFVEREIIDPATSLLLMTLQEISSVVDGSPKSH